MEQGIEEFQCAAVEYNYDALDMNSIFNKLMECEGIPEELKRNLYFIQSDQ